MNINTLLIPIILPLLGGLICLLIPKRVKFIREILSIVITGACFVFAVMVFVETKTMGSLTLLLNLFNAPIDFVSTTLSSLILVLGTFLFFLVTVFSYRLMQVTSRQFYTYLLWTVATSSIAILSNNLVLLLVVWGVIAVLLYLLILLGKPGAEKAGYKALIMVGGSDVLMLVGAGVIYYLSGTMTMSAIKLPLNSALSIIAFILLMIGVFTKAGVMPFHTWLLDASEKAPAPVLALFPSIIDKLLGIYLLIRISRDFFVVVPNSAMSIVLMSAGSLSVIAAAAMALIEKDLFKLLAYSSVSQVGYMVIGVGSGTMLGLIGGLFHLFNNTIYKTALFFSSGVVELKTKQTNLDNLGGLAKKMPITFIATFVCALSVSGIPPLSGFFSKWLVYQSLIQIMTRESWYVVIFIILAMLGSVLTLAYLLKMLYAVFLKPQMTALNIKESKWYEYLPMIILTAITILAGIFAQLPLKYFFEPILGYSLKRLELGFFSPSLSTILMLLGIIVGIVIYLLSRTRKVKTSEVFVGGEIDKSEEGVSGGDFYDSIKKVKFMSESYRIADKKYFDVFEQLRKFISIIVKAGRKVHNGLLQTYLGWLLLGVITIIIVFLIIILK